MERILVGIIAIAFGCVLIIFRKKFISDIVKLNNKGLGFRTYDKKEANIGLWFVPIFGLLVIVLGVLILAGIVPN